jgi:hypothetical protein
MGDSLGYFKKLLETNIVLDDTLLFDNPITSQVASALLNPSRVGHDCSTEIIQDDLFAELDSFVQQGDDEIECFSDLSEDPEEEECSDFDNDVNKGIKAKHDGGLASIANAIQVAKSQEVDGEFVNNPMPFNADKSWLAIYKIAELASERQFTVHGPVNVNGDWK